MCGVMYKLHNTSGWQLAKQLRIDQKLNHRIGNNLILSVSEIHGIHRSDGVHFEFVFVSRRTPNLTRIPTPMTVLYWYTRVVFTENWNFYNSTAIRNILYNFKSESSTSREHGRRVLSEPYPRHDCCTFICEHSANLSSE